MMAPNPRSPNITPHAIAAALESFSFGFTSSSVFCSSSIWSPVSSGKTHEIPSVPI